MARVRIRGTAVSDTLDGADRPDPVLILGKSGDDSLLGGGLDDLLVGGAGDDALIGRVGADELKGGSGQDVLSGGDGADTLLGGAGDDTLQGELGDDRLLGGTGADLLLGGAGDDTAIGGAGDDTFAGGTGTDTAMGGGGADLFVFRMGDGADSLDGGADPDTLRLELTGAQWADAAVRAEVFRYRDILIDQTDNPHATTTLAALDGVRVMCFEFLQVLVDGVAIDVTDDRPTAADDAFGVSEDGVLTGSVLGNDSLGVDGPVSASLVSSAGLGWLTLETDGSFTYYPGMANQRLAEGVDAAFTFTYRLTDASGDTATATATITIAGANDRPTLTIHDPVTVAEFAESASGEGLADRVFGSLASFGDVDLGDVLVAGAALTGTTRAAGTAFGTVFDNGDGTLGYAVNDGALDELAQDAVVTETYDVTITDRAGASVSDTLTVSFTGSNDRTRNILIDGVATSVADIADGMAGATVGTLHAVDPDIGDVHAYRLLAGADNDLFEVVGTALKLKDGVALDAGTTPFVTIQVEAKDSGGLTYFRDFQIDVVAVPPTVLTGDPAVAETFDLAGLADGTDYVVAGFTDGSVRTLGFDDLGLGSGGEAPLADGYGGFDWFQAGGFNNDIGFAFYTPTSGTTLAFIAEAGTFEADGYEDGHPGDPFTLSRAAPFDLLSAQFSPGTRAGITVTAIAYDADGNVVGTKAALLDAGATPFDFGTPDTGSFAGVSRVTFSANDSDDSTPDYFGLDDLTFRASDPADLIALTIDGVDTFAELVAGGYLTEDGGDTFITVGAGVARIVGATGLSADDFLFLA